MSCPVYLMVPHGVQHGWGLCGLFFTTQLAKYRSVLTLTHPVTPDTLPNPIIRKEFCRHLVSEDQKKAIFSGHPTLQGPLIHAITNASLAPWDRVLKANPVIGYTTFETPRLSPAHIAQANAHYAHIATGSNWNKQVLLNNGYSAVTVIHQGIDPHLFHPTSHLKQWMQDQFVIFSGGKFEYRKGQDLVLKAFQILHQKYPDMHLIAGWASHWPHTMKSMQKSKVIPFNYQNTESTTQLNTLIQTLGISPERITLLPILSQHEMAYIYHQSDIGLFPNRCEAGTNLVLMEYMACGKPVIASTLTGHQDILNTKNALQITSTDPQSQHPNPWEYQTPSLDETIAHLEWAYHNRNQLTPYAKAAAKSMQTRTWQDTGLKWHQFLGQFESKKPEPTRQTTE